MRGLTLLLVCRRRVQLIMHIQSLHATPTERCLLFTSSFAAEACISFIVARGIPPFSVRTLTSTTTSTSPIFELVGEIHVVLFPSQHWRVAKQFWMHTGMGISSRLAEHHLNLLGLSNADHSQTSNPYEFEGQDEDEIDLIGGDVLQRSLQAKADIRKQISSLVDAPTDDVFLYPTGMTAIWSAHQLLMRVFGDSKKSVCFGWVLPLSSPEYLAYS